VNTRACEPTHNLRHSPDTYQKRAEELLRQRDGLLLENGKLRAAVSVEEKRLQNLIHGAEQTSNGVGFHAGGGTIPVSRTRGRALCVTVAPLRNLKFNLGDRPLVLVFVADPDQQIKPAANLLRECYELTAAEARLAMPLIEGHSLKEAAEICGVTHNTAKSQLKSIFVKTNVRRQSELVKVLLVSSGDAIAAS
jgi:DNA-binding CsgD family transcriptional regulator